MNKLAVVDCLLVATSAFLLTGLGLWFLLQTRLAHHIALDVPNNRSLHNAPIPRIGGMILVPVALACTWIAIGAFPALIVSTLILCLISLLDDRFNLPITLRLGAHLLVASWLVSRHLHLPEGLILAVFSVVVIGWLANLYNFMDGVDGLAGGMALIGFSCLGIAAASDGHNLAVLAFSIAAAAAGFLVFNFPPARIFMGDSGSVPLGFLAAAIAAEGLRTALWPIWFPVMVFSPFIVDATVTLLKRIVRGERFWRPHRDHYYQRLVRMGWSHKRTVLTEYILMFCAALLALIGLKLHSSWQWLICAGWFSLLSALMFVVDQRWNRPCTIKN